MLEAVLPSLLRRGERWGPLQSTCQLIRCTFHGLRQKKTPKQNKSFEPLKRKCIFIDFIDWRNWDLNNVILWSAPLANLARQLLLPEHDLPKTQALNMYWGSGGGDASTVCWSRFLSRTTTCPRVSLLLGGSSVSPASSGHAHSPTMFWQEGTKVRRKQALGPELHISEGLCVQRIWASLNVQGWVRSGRNKELLGNVCFIFSCARPCSEATESFWESHLYKNLPPL